MGQEFYIIGVNGSRKTKMPLLVVTNSNGELRIPWGAFREMGEMQIDNDRILCVYGVGSWSNFLP